MSATGRPRGRWAWPSLAECAVVLLGLGVAVIAAHSGRPGWQIVRVGAVGVVTVLSAWVLRRPGAHLRSLLALVLGALGCGIGLGVGVPFLAKDGLSLLGVAGIATLVGGLVLLALAATWTIAAFRGWHRLAMVPAVVAGVLVSLYVLTVPLATAVAATNVPRTALGSATPGGLGLAYRDVTLRTADGVMLSGWYIPSRNRAAVIALHGSGSTRSAVLSRAAILARHGYGVLAFDARGHGRSGGRAMDFGWYGDADTAAAVSYLQGLPEIDPSRIAALGLSMGGEEAIGAMAANPGLRAVVAESATNRVAADKAWLSSVYGLQGWVQRGVEWITYQTASLLTSAPQPASLRTSVAAAAPRPVLLIAAGDVQDEGHAGRFIEASSPRTVSLWVAPRAGHTGSLAADPAVWEARVVSFLATALGGGRP